MDRHKNNFMKLRPGQDLEAMVAFAIVKIRRVGVVRASEAPDLGKRDEEIKELQAQVRELRSAAQSVPEPGQGAPPGTRPGTPPGTPPGR